MARLPLLGASYAARSIIASATRAINLFPEKNPKDSPVPLTHYQRPGLRALVAASGNSAPVRGLYRASNGNGYCVIGTKVYSISASWMLTLLGTLSDALATPVSFIDNGVTIWLVDSSTHSYQINMGTNVFATVVDATGTFTGARRVDIIDTFMIWPFLGGTQWGCTNANSLSFDATFVVNKSDYPDPIQTLIVNRHEILLLGALKSEIWYDAGNPTFPFAELPGAYIEHGIAAPYSIASADISVFWLAQDLQGQGLVLRQRGYETRRVSNHALEFAIRKMAASGSISDAIGYTYQQDGHVFYVLSFPSGDQTWVFDDSIGDPEMAWHQRAWTDSNGTLHRDRTNCHAFIYGTNVVGDWENGTLYALDLDLYVDQVSGATSPVTWLRTFPHLESGAGPDGKFVGGDGKRVRHNAFIADIQCGTTLVDANGDPPRVTLRWSDDRGATFGQGVVQTLGKQGETLTQPVWRNLGLARDRIYELSYSVSGPATLNGAWVDSEVLDS